MLNEIKTGLVELPENKRKRFKSEYSLPDADVEVFVKNKNLGNYFENVISELQSWDKLEHLKKPEKKHTKKLIKLTANYLITELQKLLGGYEEIDLKNIKINPHHFGEFIVFVFHKEISSSGAQTLLKEMFETGAEPGHIIKEKDLGQVSDTVELEKAVIGVMSENPKPVEDYKNGKSTSMQFLIGKVMAKTKGKANPQVVKEILEKELIK